MRSVLETDVLIVGSGLAGLRAAIQCRRHKVNTLVVSKSKFGTSGCTAIAEGNFRVALDKKGKTFDMTRHFNETIEGGRHICNRALVKRFVKEGPTRVLELREFGVPLAIDRNGGRTFIVARQPAGNVLARKLGEYALTVGVKALSDFTCSDLLVQENEACGALFVSNIDGKLISVFSKAIILATGGFAGLFQMTNAPTMILGDGISLAFDAGAAIQDMEFIQFEPMIADCEFKKIPIISAIIAYTKELVPYGTLFDLNGRPLLEEFGLLKEKIARDILSVAIDRKFHEQPQLKHSVLLDMTGISLEKCVQSLTIESQRRSFKKFYSGLLKKRVPLYLAAHYTMGGIRISKNAQTNVDGLFAAGEVVGGVHGANRLGANALTETTVFGAIAGDEAVKYVQTCRIRKPEDGYLTEKEKGVYEFAKKGAIAKSENPLSIRERIRSLCSTYLSPVRSGRNLRKALEELRLIEESFQDLHVEKQAMLWPMIEIKHMLKVSEISLRAAEERKESRGPHYRMDFPIRDDANWLRNIVITNRKGRIILESCIVG
jgi:fumarate reductase (CoM/CoB) subunit A